MLRLEWQLLYYCFTIASPLLPIALPLLYRCFTIALLLLYHCFTIASPLLHHSFTIALLLLHATVRELFTAQPLHGAKRSFTAASGRD
jgi:hypothetical protein